MNNAELVLAGIDVQEILDRCMNNTALLRMIIGKFLDDQTYTQLKDAIAREDRASAEFACHSLKGVSGNLSQKKLFSLMQEQLRLFRAGEYENGVALMPQIAAEYENTVFHLRLWLNQN